MKTKRNIVLAALGVTLGTVVILTQGAWIGQTNDALKLEGAWIAKVEGTPLLWTYSYAPSSPTAQSAALQGTIHVGIDPTLSGTFPDASYLTPLVGQAVLNGPNSGTYTALLHAMKAGANGPEVVYTMIAFGRIVKSRAGKVEVSHHFHIYLPSQDSDGDGIPGLHETSLLCIPVRSMDTRIPMFNPMSKNCGD